MLSAYQNFFDILHPIQISHFSGAVSLLGLRSSKTPYDDNQSTKDNSDSGGCETLETPNIFLFPSVLSFITILIWSCFIFERFILQVKVEVALFNLESVFG